MNDERWTIVDRLFDAALARDPHERAAFLDEACAHDEALRREVESLLAHEREAVGFMSTPAGAPADAVMSDGTSMMGRQLGPYAIHARLGAGGMGEVYRARDSKLGRDVAIKILPRLFTTDPERRARFDREARLLASLNHPHIGAIYGLEDMDGTPRSSSSSSRARRFRRGWRLGTWGWETPASRPQPQHQRALPLDEALHIARQIADALEAAHEKGIIHRDLKPANIKITPDGVVKVLDFGLAKAASGDASGPDLTQSPTVTIGGTRDGVILGTAAYMSPEQARGKPVDKRTDIWAFGCVRLRDAHRPPGIRPRHGHGHASPAIRRARSGLAGAAAFDAAKRHAVAEAMPRQRSQAPAARHRRRPDRDRGRPQWRFFDTSGDCRCPSTVCPSVMDRLRCSHRSSRPAR